MTTKLNIFPLILCILLSSCNSCNDDKVNEAKIAQLQQELSESRKAQKQASTPKPKLTKGQFVYEIDNRISKLNELKQSYITLHGQMQNYLRRNEGHYICNSSDNCPIKESEAVEILMTKDECEIASLNSILFPLYKYADIFSGVNSEWAKPTKRGIRFNREFEYKSFFIINNTGEFIGPYDIRVSTHVEYQDTVKVESYETTTFKAIPGILAKRVNDQKQVKLDQGRKSTGYKNTRSQVKKLRKKIKTIREGLPMIRTQYDDLLVAIDEANMDKTMINIKSDDILAELDKIIAEKESLSMTFLQHLKE